MEQNISYIGIESINYKFTEEEIKDALVEKYVQLDRRTKSGGDKIKDIHFNMYDSDGKNGYAEITVVFETVLKPIKEKKKNGKKTDNK